MADTTNKKARKCGNCGEAGHDKRKCPKIENPIEVKSQIQTQPQTIYALECAEDNGDDVDRSTMLYASIDGLVKGIEDWIVNTRTDLCHEDDDYDEDKDHYDIPCYAKDLFYYTNQESLKDVPIPKKEDVEKVLNSNKYHLKGLIIKVGAELGGSPCFACEISVHKKKLNP